jgi:hypothetical protein
LQVFLKPLLRRKGNVHFAKGKIVRHGGGN